MLKDSPWVMNPTPRQTGLGKQFGFGILLSPKLMVASLASAIVLLHVSCYVYCVDIQFRTVHGLLKTQVTAGQDSRQNPPPPVLRFMKPCGQ